MGKKKEVIILLAIVVVGAAILIPRTILPLYWRAWTNQDVIIKFPYCEQDSTFTILSKKAGAPALPMQGKKLYIDFRSSDVIETSSEFPSSVGHGDDLLMEMPDKTFATLRLEALGIHWSTMRYPSDPNKNYDKVKFIVRPKLALLPPLPSAAIPKP